MAKKRSIGGTIVTVVLLLILALVLGIAVCAFMVTATPNLSRYETADEYSLDAQVFTVMVGGELTIKPEQINRLLQDAVEDTGEDMAVVSVQVDTDDAEKELWVCVQLRALEHIWTVSLLGEIEAVVEEGTITALSVFPQKLQIGRLPIPKFVWQPLLSRVLEQTELPYADNQLTMEVPELQDLPFDLSAAEVCPEGLVLTIQPMLQLPNDESQSANTTPQPDDEAEKELLEKAQDILADVQERLASGDTSMAEIVEDLQEELDEEEFDKVLDQLLPDAESTKGLIEQLPDELLEAVPGLEDQLTEWFDVLQSAAANK